MSRTPAEDLEVDFSRAKDGIRRYWPLSIVLAMASVIVMTVGRPPANVAQAELGFSDNRVRMSTYLELTKLGTVPLKYSTMDFRSAVADRATKSITFQVSLTEAGFLGITAQGAGAADASANLDVVVDLLNESLRAEEAEIASERIAALEETISDVEAKIAAARSDAGGEVSEIVERTSLLGFLASEQREISVLSEAISSPAASIIEIRREAASGARRSGVVAGLVGGAALGLAIAVLLGFLRRRVNDEEDLRRTTGRARVFTLSNDATYAAIALGLLRLRNSRNEAAVMLATGKRSHDAGETIAGAARRCGLPLTLGISGETTAVPMLALVEPEADFESLLALPDDVTVLVAVQRGTHLDDVAAMVQKLESAGHEVAASLLMS